jgi:hypothetical protein
MIIWISLAAVVVIIVVIAVLFRLFLRADDADPFEHLDEPRRAAEESRARAAASREPVATASTRRPPARPARADDHSRPADRGRGAPDRQPAADRRSSGGHSRPAAPPARPAKPAPTTAAAQATKWDKMSDVDYWTELKAADKDLPAEPAASTGSRRRAPEPAGDIRAARSDRSDRTEILPVRSRSARRSSGSAGVPSDYGQPAPAAPRPAHSPGRYAGGIPEPATESIAALTRLGTQPRPVQAPLQPTPLQPTPLQQTPLQAAPTPPTASRPRSVPAPLDDDPLTSPSFPAINTSDSRSYRTSRSDSQPRPIPGPSYPEPAPQQRPYPAGADPSLSSPGGYPASSGGPSGNPYGSFVTQPATSYPEPASQPAAGYSDQQSGYGQHDQQPGGWYDTGQTGYSQLPTFTSPQPGYGNGAGSTDPAAYRASYPGTPPENVAYVQPVYGGVQYDQHGYVVPEPGYGADGYQGYQGYGTGGY